MTEKPNGVEGYVKKEYPFLPPSLPPEQFENTYLVQTNHYYI